MNDYFLLTGATGLLGNYLLRDLLLADRQVAVLVRAARRMSARQRIEVLMSHWEESMGTRLPRPVILEGDITQPDLGLDAVALRWATENCSAVIHNAASLNFEATNSEGEPYRSNVTGTRHVLEFARNAGIRQFHHVSTAYVAGLRSGRILESEVNLGQQLGNDYEISKLAAEELVRSSDFIDPPTIYRPGIIIGDSQTGYTTTYHGFYAALQLVHTIAQGFVTDETGKLCGSSVRLSLNGDETKHLVPVDWVSAAMTHVLTHPEHHGRTYHLTPAVPVTAAVIKEVLEESVGVNGAEFCGADHVPANDNDAEALFHNHIRVYNSYWRMDPEFDSSNIKHAAPHLPCPAISRDLLMKLSHAVIDANFPTPSKRPVAVDFDAESVMQPWVDPEREASAPGLQRLGLDIRGAGGGQWSLAGRDGHLIGVEPGIHRGRDTVAQMDAGTLGRIVQGKQSWLEAVRAGAVTFQGTGDRETAAPETAAMLDQLVGVPVS